jgi:hypothetical protein
VEGLAYLVPLDYSEVCLETRNNVILLILMSYLVSSQKAEPPGPVQNPYPRNRSTERSWSVEYLLNSFPPCWFTIMATLRTWYKRLLVAISHLPPLLDLGVVPHALHISSPIISYVFEGRKEDVGLRIMENRV